MIVGIGVDTVDMERVKRLVKEYGQRFMDRVFTEGEIEYALRSVVRSHERLAGRFAIKEAVMKALGTGKSGGILWKDVETLRGPKGEPRVALHGRAREYADRAGVKLVHASITHDGKMVVGFVILEGEGK